MRSEGISQRAIMSNLGGTVFAVFQDGAIRGLNVAQMIRSLTASTLSGWQEAKEQATDLTQLSASFRIDKGQATTTDLNLVGPLVRVTGAGTVDLGAKMLAFRVEPKLVMTTEGQGRPSDPVGLGIPVMIDGPWADPRIYPDIAGITGQSRRRLCQAQGDGQGPVRRRGGGGGLGELRSVARRHAWRNPGQFAAAGSWPEPQSSVAGPSQPTARAERPAPAAGAGQSANERPAAAAVQPVNAG